MANMDRETEKNRQTRETQGTTGGRTSPGMQESEDAGMQQMSGMLREAREEGDPQSQQQTQQPGMQQQGM